MFWQCLGAALRQSKKDHTWKPAWFFPCCPEPCGHGFADCQPKRLSERCSKLTWEVLGSLWRWTTQAELPADPQQKHGVSSSHSRELLSSLLQLCALCLLPKVVLVYSPQGCRCSRILPRPVSNGMFAYPSHLEGINVLQGTWAPTCLLQSTLSMAVYEASKTQLPHHHLPRTSWVVECQEYLELEMEAGTESMAWVSSVGLDSYQEVEQLPALKSRNRSQIISVPQPEGKWESSCLPGSQFSLAAWRGEGLRPTVLTEWSCSPLLLYCGSWLCIFGGKTLLFPHHSVLPRSFPGGNPYNHVSTCWDRKMLLITGSRGWH